MIVSAYGIKVGSTEEAFAVPFAVRKAWHDYVYALITHYRIEHGRWVLIEERVTNNG